MIINVAKLSYELQQAGIPVQGCNSNGVIWFLPEATDEQKELAQKILVNHNPVWYVEERRKIYPPLGDQFDHLYWSLKRLKDSELKDWNGIDEWFKKIEEVKNKWPKEKNYDGF